MGSREHTRRILARTFDIVDIVASFLSNVSDELKVNHEEISTDESSKTPFNVGTSEQTFDVLGRCKRTYHHI